MSKYNNTKVEADGYKFASKIEYEYYKYLLEQQKRGIVKSFEMQVPFILLDAYELSERKNRSVKYIADFVVIYSDGKEEIIDIKGMIKPMDLLKKKLFESRYKKELKFLCYSKMDGGFIDYKELENARKQRKKNKTNKI